MVDPTAVARAAAQKPQGAMQGGAPPPMGEKPPMPPPMPEGPKPDGGIDGLVPKLEEVGNAVKQLADQGNPAAQKALSSFQTFLQDMAELGGDGAPENPLPNRVPMDKVPGVQVL